MSLTLVNCNKSEKAFDLLIENVHIIDLSSGKLIENQRIGINKDTIALIEAMPSKISYTSHNTLSANGYYIIPGLWDNHVHFRGGNSLKNINRDFLRLYIAKGITGVRDAGGDLTSELLNWRKEINDNRLVGPLIFTSGPKLDGFNSRWEGSLEVESKEQITTAIDSLERLGVDYIKIYDSKISKNAYLNILKEAKKRNIITSGHMPFTVLLQEAVDSGIGAIEHLYYVLKACSSKEKEITEAVIRGEMGFWDSFEQIMNSYDEEKAQQTFKMLVENDVYVVPTLHIGEVLSYLDEVDHSSDNYLKYLSDDFIKTYQGRINGALNASDKAVARRKRLQKMFTELIPKMEKAGVKLMAGSDCGAYNSYVYPGISLHKELKAMVAAGLTPLQALKTSTYNGANFFDVTNKYGNIDIGKSSDLIILSKNPLKDISNTQSIEYVIQKNRYLKKEQLYELLKSVEK